MLIVIELQNNKTIKLILKHAFNNLIKVKINNNNNKWNNLKKKKTKKQLWITLNNSVTKKNQVCYRFTFKAAYHDSRIIEFMFTNQDSS